MKKMYLTDDGTFGDADTLRFVDTTRWTEADLDLFDNWTDGARWDFVVTGTASTTTPTEHEAGTLPTTYRIVRIYRPDLDRRDQTILTGLTLEQAQAHCALPYTRGEGWFDGYEKEVTR